MKIYITGSVASGKTTFAKKLSKQLNIKYYELDNIVHAGLGKLRPKRTPEEQISLIKEIDKNQNWIIEGTYRPSCSVVLDLADLIVFLDISLWIRKVRIIKRFLKQQLHFEKCNYKSDMYMFKLMFKWTREFEENRKEFEKILYTYQSKLIIAKNQKQAFEKIKLLK